jgi:hypothetical protein
MPDVKDRNDRVVNPTTGALIKRNDEKVATLDVESRANAYRRQKKDVREAYPGETEARAKEIEAEDAKAAAKANPSPSPSPAAQSKANNTDTSLVAGAPNANATPSPSPTAPKVDATKPYSPFQKK